MSKDILDKSIGIEEFDPEALIRKFVVAAWAAHQRRTELLGRPFELIVDDSSMIAMHNVLNQEIDEQWKVLMREMDEFSREVLSGGLGGVEPFLSISE
jgi:hypothetical protein